MSNITSTTIYENDVTVICKCGKEMKFCYYEFAMSSFNCDNCNSTFVHDDWNEPNERTLERKIREREYKKEQEAKID